MPPAGPSGSMTTRLEPRPHYLAAAGLVLLLAPAGARAESSDLVASRLARCVADLNSDEFSVRQRAMRELENAGVEAVPLVAAEVKSNDKEVRSRAIGILLAQACSKNAEQRSAARVTLEELSQSLNDKAAGAAQAALKTARDGAAAVRPRRQPPLSNGSGHPLRSTASSASSRRMISGRFELPRRSGNVSSEPTWTL